MRTAAVAAGSTGSAHADRPAAGSSRRVRRVRRAGGLRPGADNGVGPYVVAGRHGGTTVARRCRDRGQGPYLPPAAVARPGTRRGTRPRRRRGRARAGHTRPSVAAPRRGRPYPTAHDVRTAVIHRRTRRGGEGGPEPVVAGRHRTTGRRMRPETALARHPQGAGLDAWTGQRLTLPALMQEVQTLSRLAVPPTTARTDWMLGFQRRRVRRWEWEMLLPKVGFLPQTSQTDATVIAPLDSPSARPDRGISACAEG